MTIRIRLAGCGLLLMCGGIAPAQVVPGGAEPVSAPVVGNVVQAPTIPAFGPLGSPAQRVITIDNGVTIPSTYTSFYTPPASASFVGDASLTGYIPPYSYYAAPEGLPARPYVGFGALDRFPFHGQPYGYPYDRWTWNYLSGSPPASLVRYFYPPVP